MIFARSAKVKVSKVRMFGRLNNFGEQALIVTFHIVASEPTTVFLPLPVKPGGRCVTADLSAYPELFLDLDVCWEPSFVVSTGMPARSQEGAPLLDAVEVKGSAVYAKKADVSRLAQRPDDAFFKSSLYNDHGFAAFNLAAGEYDAAPMAVVFQSRETQKIFFPTLDVVAGAAPEKVERDTVLYLQAWTGTRVEGWFHSDGQPAASVDLAKARRLVLAEQYVQRNVLRGSRKNEDVWARI